MGQGGSIANRLQMFRNNRTPQANAVRANVNRIISVPPINTRAIGTAAIGQARQMSQLGGPRSVIARSSYGEGRNPGIPINTQPWKNSATAMGLNTS